MGLGNRESAVRDRLPHPRVPCRGFRGIERAENRRLLKLPAGDAQIVKALL
jgi:hypothetical protein